MEGKALMHINFCKIDKGKKQEILNSLIKLKQNASTFGSMPTQKNSKD